MPANSKEYMRAYYLENREKFREKRSLYNQANQEQNRLRSKEYYEANKEHLLEECKAYREGTKRERAEYQKEYRAKNSDRLKEAKRQYQAENKAKIRQASSRMMTRFRVAIRKAVGREMTFSLSFDEYATLIGPGICHYCGSKLSETGSGLDRKDNERYYSVDNAVPCCKRCNVTFNDLYSYKEKLVLAVTIKAIDAARNSP